MRVFFVVRILLAATGFLCIEICHAQPTDPIAELNAAIKTYDHQLRKNQYLKALESARTAFELSTEIYGLKTKAMAKLGLNYGRMLAKNDRPKMALKLLEEISLLFQEIYPKEALELIDPLMEFALASSRHHKPIQAGRLFRQAIRVAEIDKGADDILVADLNLEAGAHLLVTHQILQAHTCIRRAHSIYAKKFGRYSPQTGFADYWMGVVEMAFEQYQEAAQYFENALKTFGRGAEQLQLRTHTFLVSAYEKLEQQQRVTEHCRAIGRLTPWNSTLDREPVFKTEPRYPPGALLVGTEGYIRMEFTLVSTGAVHNPRVLETKGSKAFGKVALEAIKDWRFAPRFIDGKAVDTEDVQTLVRFKLPVRLRKTPLTTTDLRSVEIYIKEEKAGSQIYHSPSE